MQKEGDDVESINTIPICWCTQCVKARSGNLGSTAETPKFQGRVCARGVCEVNCAVR